jgi:hypothetical protein
MKHWTMMNLREKLIKGGDTFAVRVTRTTPSSAQTRGRNRKTPSNRNDTTWKGKMSETQDRMKNVVALCKRRGFIFQSSEIYGGINGFWDYGPLGVELKRNVKEAWWRDMVTGRTDMVGMDCSIIMHPKVWEASGHVAKFTDAMVDCKACKGRFRADRLEGTPCPKKPSLTVHECACEKKGKGELTDPRMFNMMFRTNVEIAQPLRRQVSTRGGAKAQRSIYGQQVARSVDCSQYCTTSNSAICSSFRCDAFAPSSEAFVTKRILSGARPSDLRVTICLC